MAPLERYCFDTSAWVNAWHKHYRPKSFPTLWDNLDGLIAEQRVFSPEEVFRETERQEDDLHQWLKSRRQLFLMETEVVQQAVIEILAKFSKIVNPRKETPQADVWVIALAKVNDLIVVSYEEARRSPLKKIPGVCKELKIRHLTLGDLIEEMGWVFR